VLTAGLEITVGPVTELNPDEGDHVYMTAPAPVIETDPPAHITAGFGTDVTITSGKGFIETTTLAADEHPDVVPLTVYVILTEGLAVTFAPVVVFRPAAGDQV